MRSVRSYYIKAKVLGYLLALSMLVYLIFMLVASVS